MSTWETRHPIPAPLIASVSAMASPVSSSVPSLRGLFRASPPKSRRKPATSSRPIRPSDRTGWRGTWDNAQGIGMSLSTMKRLKRAVRLETDPAPVVVLAPTANWLFYERKHPHSLWHGDCLEKVILADTGRQAYHLVFLDDYSRGYVFCDLLREVTTCITIEAMIAAMRQWQVIPKQVLFDNGGPFRGKLLAAFCQNLGRVPLR